MISLEGVLEEMLELSIGRMKFGGCDLGCE
jgi:hypothetical protein